MDASPLAPWKRVGISAVAAGDGSRLCYIFKLRCEIFHSIGPIAHDLTLQARRILVSMQGKYHVGWQALIDRQSGNLPPEAHRSKKRQSR